MLALLALWLAPAGAAVAQTAQASGEALVELLRSGGQSLYFRHAATDWGQADQVRGPEDFPSCDRARMRQLSEAGRDVARAVGAAIRALHIPVGRVLASPYCRTVETARLMGLGGIETTDEVMNLRVAEYFGGRLAIVKTARALLARLPVPGTNTVIVAHGNVAREATDVYPAEGEGLVFRPDGGGGFDYVGRISPGEWALLLPTPVKRK
jgi:broad specificity phosphatase PhoE